MTENDTRICPFCAETIHANARVCPRCRQWLCLRSLRNPLVGIFVLSPLMLAGFVLVFWAGFSRLGGVFNPRPFYSEMPGALRVLDSRMNWVDTTNGPRIYLTGMLTNQSTVAWGSIEFECRFFDTNSVMVDAANASSHFTIQSNDDSAFRVIVVPGRPQAEYHSVKVTVSSARNARSAF